jgi:hypothetical protein
VTFDFKNIVMPVIRTVKPTLLADKIIGIQPLSTFSSGIHPDYRIFNLKFRHSIDYYILYKSHPRMVTTMNILHTSIRPFMRALDDEPNTKYRPWLEENVGVQGTDWDWKIHSVDGNKLAIDFNREESAILFELKWPY